MRRILASVAQAGMTASFYVLGREVTGLPSWDVQDPLFCAVLATTVLVFGWSNRNVEPQPTGVLVGFKAAGALAAAVFVPFILTSLAQFASWGRVSWYTGPLIVLLLPILFVALAAAVVGGYITGTLFDFMVRGRSGPSLALALTFLSLVVPAGATATRWTEGLGIVDFVVRFDALRPFPAEVVVDLEVKGTALRIERIIYCRRLIDGPDRNRMIESRIGVKEPRWLPSIKSFGQSLGDGSGVFVITPDGCQVLSRTKQPGAAGLTPGYVPVIGWTPDATTLDRIDIYVDPRTLFLPDAAVSLRSVSMRRLPLGTSESPPDTFAGIGWQGDVGSSTRYRAVFAAAIPQERWGTEVGISTRLRALTVPTYGLGELKEARSKTHRYALEWDLPTTCWLPLDGQGLRVPTRAYGVDVMSPLRLERDVWTAALGERGVLSFYRLPENRWDATLPRVIAVGERAFTRSDGRYAFSTAWFFDPASDDLWTLAFVVCNLGPG